LPDGLNINTVILVPEPVTYAADVAPLKARTQDFGLVAEPDRSFADYLEFAFHGGNGFRILAERLHIHTLRKLLDRIDGFGNIA
jgi:hypothetical protein